MGELENNSKQNIVILDSKKQLKILQEYYIFIISLNLIVNLLNLLNQLDLFYIRSCVIHLLITN